MCAREQTSYSEVENGSNWTHLKWPIVLLCHCLSSTNSDCAMSNEHIFCKWKRFESDSFIPYHLHYFFQWLWFCTLDNMYSIPLNRTGYMGYCTKISWNKQHKFRFGIFQSWLCGIVDMIYFDSTFRPSRTHRILYQK